MSDTNTNTNTTNNTNNANSSQPVAPAAEQNSAAQLLIQELHRRMQEAQQNATPASQPANP